MTARPVLTALLLVGALSACGSGDAALTRPPTPTPAVAAPSATPAPGAAASQQVPSASPSTEPAGAAPRDDGTAVPPERTALETDPAVRAVHAWYAAAARAVNADDLLLPELVALSTPARAQLNPSAFIADRGGWVPGPTPFTALTATRPSATRATVVGCALDSGWVRDRPGGRPTAPESVVALRVDLVLEARTWKVDRVETTSARCAGVALDRGTAR